MTKTEIITPEGTKTDNCLILLTNKETNHDYEYLQL